MNIDDELREMMAAPRAVGRVFRRLERWRRSATPVAPAMSEALGMMREYRPGAPWARLAGVDWGADRAMAAHWLQDTLVDRPLPALVKGLWVAVPEFGQGGELTVCGCDSFSASPESEWASGVVWPAGDQRAPAMRSRALQEVEKAAGRSSARAFVDYAVPLVYVSLLMLEVLPLVSPRLTVGTSRGRGVGCGFNSGDWRALGVLTSKGWRNR